MMLYENIRSLASTFTMVITQISLIIKAEFLFIIILDYVLKTSVDKYPIFGFTLFRNIVPAKLTDVDCR